jgi:O-antigen/teichoic acid export membrane protein
MTNWREKATLGGRWLGASTLIGAAVSLLQTAIIARFFLGPNEYGLIGIVTVFSYIALMFSDIGLGIAIVHKMDATREQLSSVYWLNIFAMLVCVSLAYSLAYPLARLMAEPLVAPMTRAITLVVLFEALGKPFQMQLERDTRFRIVGSAEIAGHITAFSVAILFAALGAGVWSLVWGQIARAFTKAIIYLPVGLKYYRPLLRFKLKDVEGFVSFGIFQMGERIVHAVATRFDFFLIGRFLGIETLGIYNLSVQLADVPVTQFATTIVRTALPLLASVQHDKARLQRAYVYHAGIQMLILSPVLFGMMAVAPVAVPLALGDQWIAAVPLLQWLSMVAVVRAADMPRAALVLATGRAGLSFYYNMIIFVLLMIVIAAAVYWGTIITVAISLLVTYLGLNLIVYFVVVRPIVGDCYLAYLSRISSPIIASAFMAAVVLAVGHSKAVSNQLLLVLLQIAIGAALYIGMMHVWRLDQLRELASILPRRFTPGYLRTQGAVPA